MPTNRLVALLTPAFSAVAAIGTAWARKHCPGLPVPSVTELVGIELSAATAAAGAALKWLHGHQKWEERADHAAHWAAQAAGDAHSVAPEYAKEIEKYVQGQIAALEARLSIVSDAEEFAAQPTPTGAPAGQGG